jgi:hypothetical protein
MGATSRSVRRLVAKQEKSYGKKLSQNRKQLQNVVVMRELSARWILLANSKSSNFSGF